MAIKRSRKANPNFNMSSMTDIVFLLLIFFMVTSTLINPNAVKIITAQKHIKPPIVRLWWSLSIEPEFLSQYESHSFSRLEGKIVELLKNSDDPCISIEAEKSVPIEQVVRVMNSAKTYGYSLFWLPNRNKYS